jgi:hypothetical protein
MPKFNKRHYEAIAEICQQYRAHVAHFNTAAQRLTWHTEFEVRLADMFKADNYRFKLDRFLYACRPGANVKARTAHLKAPNGWDKVEAE